MLNQLQKANDAEMKRAVSEAEEFIKHNGFYGSARTTAILAVSEYILFKQNLFIERK